MLDVLLGQQLGELGLERLERSELIDVGKLHRLYDTISVLGEDQYVDHPDEPAINEREQLLCHLSGEVRRARREFDDQVVDWSQVIQRCITHPASRFSLVARPRVR